MPKRPVLLFCLLVSVFFPNFPNFISSGGQMGNGCVENWRVNYGRLLFFLLILLLHIDARHLLHLPYILTLLVYGLGLGLVTTPLTRVVLSTIPAEEAGTASGLFNTVMYLANSLGVALSSIVFTIVLGHTLTNATMSNYVSAFSASLMLCGGLSLSAYVCLVFFI